MREIWLVTRIALAGLCRITIWRVGNGRDCRGKRRKHQQVVKTLGCRPGERAVFILQDEPTEGPKSKRCREMMDFS